MTEEPTTTKIVCPNCQGEAVKEGNKIICETCDATFTFTKTGGAKLKAIGRLDDIEQRLDRVESLLPGEEPQSVEDPIEETQEQSILGQE